MHSKMRPKYKPTINGKVVDLDLLYQIVTSHGGWEKVNTRNEWDDLLEHFHLPRGTNGGLVIKQIYLKYLENYEKIYFLGEDAGAKDELEDDYDDVRNRRRAASKLTTRSTPAATNPFGQPVPQTVLNPLSDAMREQLGLHKSSDCDYGRLALSLQSPLPNEQDLAISVCTLLSNETKHVLRLAKCPHVLTFLLGHAGVYRDCGVRQLLQEAYLKGRDLDFAKFWEEIPMDSEAKALLCEAYVKKIQSTMGIEEESTTVVEEVSLPSSESDPDPEDLDVPTPMEEGEESSEGKELVVLSSTVKSAKSSEIEDPEQFCCQLCPCSNNAKAKEETELPPTLTRSQCADDKVGRRVQQIAAILRNLSFEEDNAVMMAENTTMLRYLLLTINSSYGNLMQASLDTLSNISKYMKLEDPSKDPISSLLLSSIINGLFSQDRMKVVSSLDTIRHLSRVERNEKIMSNVLEKKVCERLCELLTLCDIMLLIYTLECILAVTEMGETACNEIVRVNGSVSSFISLVTVEAQSYGPKGCINMRVVETLTPGVASSTSQPSQASGSVSQGSSSKSTTMPPPSSTNSIQAIGLRTVTGQSAATPVSATSLSPATFANSPSPMSGTVSAVSVSQNQLRTPSPVPLQQVRLVTHTTAGSTATFVITPYKDGSTRSTSPSSTGSIPTQGKPGLPSPIPTTTSVPNNSNSSNQDPVVVNHVGQLKNPTSAVTGAAPAQVTSQPLMQQVFTPTFSSDNITEEAWATAWLKGGFEQWSGTSIEEGELYRMYCVARKKPPASMLSQSQLVQCVKLAYGASVGPVMKSFGSTSLSFIEGIRPKINLQQTNSVPLSNSVATDVPVSVATNGVISDGAHSGSNSAPRPSTPVSGQHGATSPLSPILKATLSRPPTPKSPTQKNAKTRKGKDIKRKGRRAETTTSVRHHLSSGKSLIPSSSAIRSLLASKVAQRQQKKLQENKKGKSPSTVKMNGETVSEKEESSASSSLNSIEDGDSKTDPKKLTFQGVLCNGTGDSGKDDHSDIDGIFNDLAKKEKDGKGGMLVDLLERKVANKEAANGIVGREIRISDKGLELIQNQKAELDGALLGDSMGSTDSVQEPQKMTFYASPEVVPSEQNCIPVPASNTPETVLLSGGGETSTNTSQVVSSEGSLSLVSAGNGDENANGASSTLTGDGSCNAVDSNNSNGGGGAGNDLLEKFSQFSDLIVVNPEQLGIGLKRSASTDDEGSSPPKKPCVNGTDESSSQSESSVSSSNTQPLAPTSTTGTPQIIKAVSINTEDGTKIAVSTNSMLPGIPLRLLNTQNSQQITFSTAGGRHMVLPGPIVLQANSSPAAAAAMAAGLQGQVIISKPSGPGNEAPKAFILIPQQSGTGQVVQAISAPITAATSSAVPAAQVQELLKQYPENGRNGIPPHAFASIPQDVLENELPFLCEWSGCGYRFPKYQQVFQHAMSVHCPENTEGTAVRCEWGPSGCDPLLRKKFSIMTHLQDRHCNKQALELACYRRKNKIEAPPVPQQPAHHPGYAPNAAFHAIKRHALQYMNPKEMMEENEGPVTKSIRLTSALILRNLVNFSAQGRRMIASHESQLAAIAMSNAESSRTIAQLLYDMNESAD